MEYRKLGNTDIDVSVICLGTMTWGEQNTFEEGYEQMDYAVDQGVNFFDTAELYPIPPKPDTQGKTEECIGNWFKKTGKIVTYEYIIWKGVNDDLEHINALVSYCKASPSKVNIIEYNKIENSLFISALNKENLEDFRKRVYDAVREIHITRFPYNRFLYPDYEETIE